MNLTALSGKITIKTIFFVNSAFPFILYLRIHITENRAFSRIGTGCLDIWAKIVQDVTSSSGVYVGEWPKTFAGVDQSFGTVDTDCESRGRKWKEFE